RVLRVLPLDRVANALPTSSDTLPDGWLDVRLAKTRQPSPIHADGTWRVLAVDGVQMLDGRGQLTLEVVDGVLLLDGRPTNAGPLEVRPEPDALLSYGGSRYRGVLRLSVDDGRAVVVNRLPLEAYLRGVVPSEMPARFPAAALEAQAVAARTYALYESDTRGLLADDRSQVYGGYDAESVWSDAAVEATTGRVLLSHGHPIPAWYHSTCGGRTRPATDVFPSAPDDILHVAVECPDCEGAPMFSWTRRFLTSAVCEAASLPIGRVHRVGVDRDDGGRARLVHVTAGNETNTVTADRFRTRLSSGLPLKSQMLSTFWDALPSIRSDGIEVRGFGWGHGVGLCQWGARGFAKRGATADEILARYYPGATLGPSP
ncbi:SpoIID/LytB domain-containing protein, partial [Nitrococcus mobilis]